MFPSSIYIIIFEIACCDVKPYDIVKVLFKYTTIPYFLVQLQFLPLLFRNQYLLPILPLGYVTTCACEYFNVQ